MIWQENVWQEYLLKAPLRRRRNVLHFLARHIPAVLCLHDPTRQGKKPDADRPWKFSLEKITWKKETGNVICRFKRNFGVFSAADFLAGRIPNCAMAPLPPPQATLGLKKSTVP
jgi:hypothetical protein